MYQKDILKDYISNSELRVFNERIKVRLSKELAQKYDNGSYTNYLMNIQKYLEIIDNLNIKYPGNAHPILYIYIVPDENHASLLKVPTIFKSKGNGKPVTCYDLDGFNCAYGISQNLAENKSLDKPSIAKIENEIHELSHIIHSQFFITHQTISEGFAETLPLYALGYEDVFDKHLNVLLNLDESQIFSAQEMLISEKDKSFGAECVLPNETCSFRLSYISSYLLIRGCVETIVQKKSFSKANAIQYFLEIVKQSKCTNEWLIYDIANALGIPQETLLNSTELQIKTLKGITNNMSKNH